MERQRETAPPGRTSDRSGRPHPARGRRTGQPDDAELVARAAQGDTGAFALIYERHHAVVTRVVAARVGRQDDPADAVQDTFTAAWRQLHTLRQPDQLRPWLLQIARRTAIDQGRRYQRRRIEADGHDLLPEVADDGPGPEELGELGDLAQRVGVGLDGLSRRDATAISLATHFGFGTEEIAAAPGRDPRERQGDPAPGAGPAPAGPGQLIRRPPAGGRGASPALDAELPGPDRRGQVRGQARRRPLHPEPGHLGVVGPGRVDARGEEGGEQPTLLGLEGRGEAVQLLQQVLGRPRLGRVGVGI